MDQLAANAEDLRIPVDRDFQVPILVSLLLRRQKVLLPVLDPFNRAPQQHRGRGERAVFGIKTALGSEPAADVGRDDAQLMVRPIQQVQQNTLMAMRALARDVDRERFLHRIGRGDHAAAFHGECSAAMLEDVLAEHVGRRGERRLDIADGKRDQRPQIAERGSGGRDAMSAHPFAAPRRSPIPSRAPRNRSRPSPPRPRQYSDRRRRRRQSDRRRSRLRPWPGNKACKLV